MVGWMVRCCRPVRIPKRKGLVQENDKSSIVADVVVGGGGDGDGDDG